MSLLTFLTPHSHSRRFPPASWQPSSIWPGVMSTALHSVCLHFCFCFVDSGFVFDSSRVIYVLDHALIWMVSHHPVKWDAALCVDLLQLNLSAWGYSCCADVEASAQRQMCVFDLERLSALLCLFTEQRLFFHPRGPSDLRSCYVMVLLLGADISCSDNRSSCSAAASNCLLYGDQSMALTVRLHWGCSSELGFRWETPSCPFRGPGELMFSRKSESISVSLSETRVHISRHPQNKYGGSLWEVSSGQDEECGTVCGLAAVQHVIHLHQQSAEALHNYYKSWQIKTCRWVSSSLIHWGRNTDPLCRSQWGGGRSLRVSDQVNRAPAHLHSSAKVITYKRSVQSVKQQKRMCTEICVTHLRPTVWTGSVYVFMWHYF